MNLFVVGNGIALTRRKYMNDVSSQVINTLKRPPHSDRPGDGRRHDAEHGLDFVQQLNGFTNLAVHFVYKSQDGRITQATYIHQLDGPLFDTFSPINHHQATVDGR